MKSVRPVQSSGSGLTIVIIILSVVGVSFLGCVFFGALLIIPSLGRRDKDVAVIKPVGAPPVGAPPVVQPEPKKPFLKQADFTQTVEGFIPKYNAAENELKKSTLRAERRQALEALFAGVHEFEASEWEGTLISMMTTNDGKARIRIRLSSKVSVSNYSPALFSSKDISIAMNTPLYDSVAKLTKQDSVKFSGTFVLN